MPNGFGDFGRNLKKQVEGIAQAELRKRKAAAERLSRSHKGRPVADIKAALRQAGISQEPQLTRMAEAIHHGTPVTVTVPNKILG